MKKLVSVFINVYNAEQFILETVNSVLNQSYENIQLIVIDDGSSDKTYELLESIKDDRLELYRNDKNMGISYSCNRCIRLCRGDYIAHVDSDDVWLPDKIEKQLNFLETNPEYGACFSLVDVIDAKSNICENPQPDFKTIFSMENMTQAEMFRYFLENSNRICHSSMFASAKAIKHHRLAARYLHDYDCWLRMLLNGPIYIIQEPLLKYRVHADNNSNMNEAKWIAHDTELLNIIDNAIENCSDELFLQAFSDKLRFKGEHTHEEVLLEKALYCIDNIYRFKSNPILAVKRLTKLFDSNEKYATLAAEKFGFTLKDFYNLQAIRLYADVELINNQKTEIDNQTQLIKSQEQHIANQKQTIDDLLQAKAKHDKDYKEIEALVKEKDSTIQEMGNSINDYHNAVMDLQKSYDDLGTQYNNLQSGFFDLTAQRDELADKHNDLQAVYLDLSAQHNELINKYNFISNSFFWRMTLPLRKLYGLFKKS